jgi:peptidoglycan/xylan/chitin deacetylase (PgdA/CDA1 family)
LQNDFGIEFGSHSCSHPKLTSLTPDEVTREFKESQTLIARNLNKGAMTFAYPYGDYNRAIAEQARQSGYTCAVTTDEGVNDQSTGVFALRRTLIGDDDDRISFAVRVSGVTSWLRFKSS